MKQFLRKEDEPLLQGRALFVDDLPFVKGLEAAFVRSPCAHAKVLRVRSDKALAVPGVRSVVCAADLPQNCRRLGSPTWLPAIRMVTDYVLAETEVRYVGEPVAVVVADNRYIAEDAAELVEVEYESLPACSDLAEALLPGSPLVHPELGSNLVGEKISEVGKIGPAFARADLVLRERLEVHRGTSSPLETRGIVAVPHDRQSSPFLVEIWASTQSPYRLRDLLASLLGVPADRICVRAPFVGGGFGPKSGVYPEDFIIPWLALKTGVPVKWIEDRREHLLCARQERDQIHHVEVACTKEGKITGLSDEFIQDVGSYSSTVIPPWTTAYTIPGPYKIPNLKIHMKLAFTHKVPIMTVRGAGRPEAVFVMERIVDRIARTLSLDPVEVRRRNFLTPEDMPWDTGLTGRDGAKIVYESGDFPQALDRVLDAIDYRETREKFAGENKDRRNKRGIGLACYVASTGMGPFEFARIRIESTGKIFVYVGTSPQGQGHHTSLAQICADELGVSPENVTVITGDTSLISEGFGTFASRSTVTSGNAVASAAQLVREKLKSMLTGALGSSADEVFWEKQHSVFKRKHRRFSFAEAVQWVAGRSEGSAAFPFEEMAKFEAPVHTYASGAHGAAVEVDVETGKVKLLKYVAAHDCGRAINPVIVEGQIQGGVAHGIGNSLFEKVAYDENGQPLSSTFKDYLLPLSTDVGPIEVLLIESPSPKNPLGLKGVGESGAIGVPAAIISAVEDALREFGVKINAVPLAPEDLLRLMEQAQDRARKETSPCSV